MKLFALAALMFAVFPFDCGHGGHCLAACPPMIAVSFDDAQGAPIKPGRGTITVAGNTEEFDCTNGDSGSAPDGGQLNLVTCSGTALTIMDPGIASELELDVRAANSEAAFVGPVTLTWAPNGQVVCGSACQVASPTVTLR